MTSSMRFCGLIAGVILLLAQGVALAADEPAGSDRAAVSVGAGPPAMRPAGRHFRDCPVCPEMVSIPAGTFMMGSPPSEEERFDTEGPQHPVTVRAFAVGVYDVTRKEYARFVRESGHVSSDDCKVYNGKEMQRAPHTDWRDPQFKQTGRDPVVCVSWEDAQAYIAWLNDKSAHSRSRPRKSGEGPYRLLTEAEWEYAARAGATTRFYWGDRISRDKANYGPDQRYFAPFAEGADRWMFTSPVGSFPANGFGLFDMVGNVWQFTEDCWHDTYVGAPTDGSAWMTGDCGIRVVRGASWYKPPSGLRSAKRGKGTPDDLKNSQEIGFRVARTMEER